MQCFHWNIKKNTCSRKWKNVYVCEKNLHNQCTLRDQIGHVTSINNPNTILIAAIPHHLKDLSLIMGSITSESDIGNKYTKSSESARVFGFSTTMALQMETTQDLSQMHMISQKKRWLSPLLRWSTKIKTPALSCHICSHDHEQGEVYRRKWLHSSLVLCYMLFL